jgi:hypothetical protein
MAGELDRSYDLLSVWREEGLPLIHLELGGYERPPLEIKSYRRLDPSSLRSV